MPLVVSSISPPAAAPAKYEPVLERVSEPVPLAAGAPNEYVVQVGDTLWDISSKFLKDPWLWPEIWYINPDIENPHLIYPGDVLGLVTIDGQTRITNVRASTYRLSPQARVTPLSQAVTSIPFEDVASFLSSGVVLEKSQADALPYLLATRGDHMIASAGNEVYVRGISASEAPSTRYNLVHVGDPMYDPDDNRLIGYHGIMIGEGSLRRTGDPATVALTSTSQEAVVGDRFLARPRLEPVLELGVVGKDVENLVIGAVDGGQLVLLLVLLTSSLLNAAYFLPIVYRAFFAAAPEGEETGYKEAPAFCLVPLCLTALGSLLLFFLHDWLLRLAQMALGIAP